MNTKKIVETIAIIGMAIFVVGMIISHFIPLEAVEHIKFAGALLILVKYIYKLFHFQEYKTDNLTFLGIIVVLFFIAFIFKIVKGL